MEKTSDVYEKIYHYTTWDGLLGILKTQTLWTTHYRFLNDYSEIVLFRDKLVSLILPYVREAYEKLVKQSPNIGQQINQEGGLDRVVQHDAEVVVDAQYRATGDEIYILSFCGQHKTLHINNNGLLSQWRGYGSGGGFALVFDTRKLEGILDEEAKRYEYSAMHLADLIYSDDEERLKAELSEDLSVIANDVRNLFDPTKSTLEEKALKGYREFVNCVSRYKHCGFGEENEVRAVILPTIIDQEYLDLAKTNGVTLKPEKQRKFGEKNGQLIPYIELFNSPDIELPIESIIVGPHKDKEARAATLRVMLRNTKIEITCSDIPFVG
jgi:Protein of unknown function (DUF2971)